MFGKGGAHLSCQVILAFLNSYLLFTDLKVVCAPLASPVGMKCEFCLDQHFIVNIADSNTIRYTFKFKPILFKGGTISTI